MYDAFKEIREEGISIGKAEERVKNIRENITRMLALHLSVGIIAKSLGISEDEVKQYVKDKLSKE